MKKGFLVVLTLQFLCCRDITPDRYAIKLPPCPVHWAALLGEPCWKLEWLDTEGQKQTMEISAGKEVEPEIPITWANPVLAWPFWPSFSLVPGFFKPAGALFPFDAKTGTLNLSWEAGVDALFYLELAFANSKKELSKIPANFDWIRFRELFEQGTLSEQVCKDPWLPDWPSIAEKTIESSFDRRRIVARSAKTVEIPAGNGPWYSTSPFAEPLVFDGEAIFPVYTGLNLWVSTEGLLKINGDVWVFTPWEEVENE